jgi:pimeloyl-ACP methyl ester carboxylesterase
MDPLRRTLLTTGAAATAMAAAPRAFAQQSGQGGSAMSFYERGPVRIRYEETGSGFPLLLIAGGGLNSTIANFSGPSSPFNPIEEFKGEFRCIASDLRNANGGQSSGPLEVDRPWDAYTDDHLGVMDHLGIQKFMVLGFCIGGPFIWNLLRRAPDRVVAAVLAQPSGSRPEMRDLFYDNNMKGWGPELVKRRPDITMETVDKFLTRKRRCWRRTPKSACFHGRSPRSAFRWQSARSAPSCAPTDLWRREAAVIPDARVLARANPEFSSRTTPLDSGSAPKRRAPE